MKYAITSKDIKVRAFNDFDHDMVLFQVDVSGILISLAWARLKRRGLGGPTSDAKVALLAEILLMLAEMKDGQSAKDDQ